MPSITLNNLSVGYLRGRRSPISVLTHINATLQSGRLTCLVGANGIGKSTLLRTLVAFQPPLAGQILYNQGDNHAPHQSHFTIANPVGKGYQRGAYHQN